MACSRAFMRNILHASRKSLLAQQQRCYSITATNLVKHQNQELSSLPSIKDIRLANDSPGGSDIDLNPFSKLDQTKKAFVEDLRPPLKRSFNLAAYVNSSETLQQLIKLGVSLFDIENTNIEAAKQLVLLDFKEHCVPYIKFLVDHSLKEKNIGRFISEYPTIFQVPLDELKLRIEYLESKGFSRKQISKALNRSCRILSDNIKSMDYKLGQFQIEFQMPAEIIREIVSDYPPVIALPSGQYKMINFTLTEEFGFSREEVHSLLKQQPKILDILRPVLIERLDLVHNTIGLSHGTICKFPKLLTGPILEIRHRFSYLERLRRNQFDPKKPLYVPPSALYSIDDNQFCEQYAKTSLEDYKLFLRNY
uniref:mTERF domain-containing protein 1, mitochondrial n=1 Tax=Aceria tosichella TaxID=561515 RepID=A0A6G1SEP3_9ACAR